MTKAIFEDKVGTAIWKMIVGGIGAITILVGAIAWASSVDTNAKQALKLGEENKVQIEQLRVQLQVQSSSLTEMRVDLRYLISAVDEVKRRVQPVK
jgi:hypothetical protein